MRKWLYLLLGVPWLVFSISSSERLDYEKALINHMIVSIDKAEHEISRLSQGVLQIEGMSSPKVRHLLNNICTLPKTTYLEIGCYKGSTWVSSLFGNQDTILFAYAIDNWSEFLCQEALFMENCKKFITFNRYRFLSVDAFSTNARSAITRPITVYFYDGFHSVEAQELAFTYYNDLLDDVFIAIVDDWNWAAVQEGTKRAFQKLNYQILFERELLSEIPSDTKNWWNGLYVAVLRKPNL